jgi:hypothetical protein
MKKAILLVFILFGQITLNGQTISGRVSDENQNPLPYVNIGIIGLNRGTISCINGRYHIDVSNVDNEKLLRFSAIGYESVGYSGDIDPPFRSY